MLQLIVSIAVMLTRYVPGLVHLYRHKAGTGATSYASLAARTSVESAGPKTTPSTTSRFVEVDDPVHLANRFALLTNDSVESPASD
ncbi:hypothetical protein E2C01_102691 [Portunus trituberculatus]|uniref:Uncharacterized protein n=1 Tax=Portunus trituberculatus TaxID=210409 RepID=A0A5B7KHY2_PORTR|nr:hypothetical protein [Portunus trituberculatus]